MENRFKKLMTSGTVLCLAFCLAACSQSSKEAGGSADKPTIKIGSKNFTEQYILGELYAQALDAAGFNVERKLNLGGTQVAFTALQSGEIDLYPEYTGTALQDVLKESAPNDETAVYEAVKKGYKEKFDIETLDQTPFNNTYVIVTTADIADKYGLKTLSDLSAKAPELNFALIPEFGDREDGLPGLQKTYGGFEFKSAKLFDIGLKYKALTDKQVDVTIGFGTDGQIAGFKLVSLEDDKKLWPPYHAIPQVRSEVLKNNPEVGDILNKINALLTDEAMAALNWEVDGETKKEPEDVAEAFLKENGFLK
ncbi:glycine betaine ABC transporter substrate-binding protein [Paenibacillus sp. PL91]|uniref:ABC transporter substrate-binding protein n=1 Tax=Paenibacillus sp. PL91 TaxID=2729538 RepID=UPI00145EBDA5|nr:glycine betaine ABC transporter substrate-binding protein [Paenibacillus sp. PL91]MBC9199456.1 glycine/betaine ABC transporter substrate-binding protein [Paenibacillus sp. PL91]